MDKTTAEFEKFLTWFSELDEIPIYTRRDFIAHVIEIGGIDEKAAKFIDETLAHIEDNNARQIVRLEQEQNMVQFLVDKTPEMEEQDIANAEAEMQRIADKFTTEYRAAEAMVNEQAETAEQESETNEAESFRATI